MSMSRSMLSVLDRLTDPARRTGAAAELAHLLDCDHLMIYAADPELGLLVPVAGPVQSMEEVRQWRRFAERCAAEGEARGTVRLGASNSAAAHGCAVGDGVVVIVEGGRCEEADLCQLKPMLAVVGALFRLERRVETGERQNEMLRTALAERTAEVERVSALAESADRSKSDFLANMSHELRTPLNAILGYTELLAMEVGGALTHEQHSHVDRIRASSRHLLTLINDVLDLAKIEGGQMRIDRAPARIGSAMEEAVALMHLDAAQHGVKVEIVRSEDDVSYMGDGNRVCQIVTNLLSNAIKFTPVGGRVLVTSGTAQPPAEAKLAGGAWTFISVEDTGIGMTKDILEKVFRPFVQADPGRSRSHGGTGLGLTICRQLARLMGGDVTVSSAPGAGSRFTLWLPQTGTAPGTLDMRLLVRTVEV